MHTRCSSVFNILFASLIDHSEGTRFNSTCSHTFRIAFLLSATRHNAWLRNTFAISAFLGFKQKQLAEFAGKPNSCEFFGLLCGRLPCLLSTHSAHSLPCVSRTEARAHTAFGCCHYRNCRLTNGQMAMIFGSSLLVLRLLRSPGILLNCRLPICQSFAVAVVSSECLCHPG